MNETILNLIINEEGKTLLNVKKAFELSKGSCLEESNKIIINQNYCSEISEKILNLDFNTFLLYLKECFQKDYLSKLKSIYKFVKDNSFMVMLVDDTILFRIKTYSFNYDEMNFSNIISVLSNNNIMDEHDFLIYYIKEFLKCNLDKNLLLLLDDFNLIDEKYIVFTINKNNIDIFIDSILSDLDTFEEKISNILEKISLGCKCKIFNEKYNLAGNQLLNIYEENKSSSIDFSKLLSKVFTKTIISKLKSNSFKDLEKYLNSYPKKYAAKEEDKLYQKYVKTLDKIYNNKALTFERFGDKYLLVYKILNFNINNIVNFDLQTIQVDERISFIKNLLISRYSHYINKKLTNIYSFSIDLLECDKDNVKIKISVLYDIINFDDFFMNKLRDESIILKDIYYKSLIA